ncbi:MAG: FmdB family zinc ribbon protein [Dissulfurispiraceae bacterium]
MPIFEYRCNMCGNEFEKLVFADCTINCPKCSSPQITKKFSVFGMSGVEKQTSSGCTSCSSSSCSSCK